MKEKNFMVDDYILMKVFHKIERIICIEHFHNTKILMGTDDKLPEDITVKIVVILVTCIIKDDDKV